MKDLPHHMKKLNRRIVRSEHREMETEVEEGVELQSANIERPKEEMRKIAKSEMRKETLEHTPEVPTEEERNLEMKHRIPVFDRTSNPRPKRGAKPRT